MVPVKIFLSTGSDEFRAYRDQLRADLTPHSVSEPAGAQEREAACAGTSRPVAVRCASISGHAAPAQDALGLVYAAAGRIRGIAVGAMVTTARAVRRAVPKGASNSPGMLAGRVTAAGAVSFYNFNIDPNHLLASALVAANTSIAAPGLALPGAFACAGIFGDAATVAAAVAVALAIGADAFAPAGTIPVAVVVGIRFLSLASITRQWRGLSPLFAVAKLFAPRRRTPAVPARGAAPPRSASDVPGIGHTHQRTNRPGLSGPDAGIAAARARTQGPLGAARRLCMHGYETRRSIPRRQVTYLRTELRLLNVA